VDIAALECILGRRWRTLGVAPPAAIFKWLQWLVAA